jgi:hypothetical protein
MKKARKVIWWLTGLLGVLVMLKVVLAILDPDKNALTALGDVIAVIIGAMGIGLTIWSQTNAVKKERDSRKIIEKLNEIDMEVDKIDTEIDEVSDELHEKSKKSK